MPCELDLVDVDIQGSEYNLFTDNETLDLLTARAHRLHIGTHNHEEAPNREIEKRFNDRGWITQWFFVGLKKKNKYGWFIAQTDFGQVQFADGVLSLANPNPIRC